MKTITVLTTSAIFIFFCNSLVAQTGWQQVTSPQSGYELHGIYFNDINTGVCSKFKTTDGGNSWYQTSPGGNFAMFFIDQNTGYRTGSGITKTTNFGENWISQTNPGGILYGVYFINANTGYACGGSGSIIKTTNGGANWNLLSSPVTSNFYLRGAYFFDTNSGFISGYETTDYTSVIINTTNGGTNWSMQSFGSNTGYATLLFVNQNTGIVVGATIARTTNAGNSWQPVTDPANSFYRQVYFSSANTGYAVGFYGIIIKTTDAGASWFRQTTNVSSDLQSVYFMNDNTGFACGDNGVVLKTTDGGGPPFGITPINSEVPKNYVLYQNYPNPFNPDTKIKFSVLKTDDTKLIIYNELGQMIRTLIHTRLSPGIYEVIFDASSLPSGVYFYRLENLNYHESKKMVLIR
jgi:photosystem II stability/assembly factor-like uncharacterized protein